MGACNRFQSSSFSSYPGYQYPYHVLTAYLPTHNLVTALLTIDLHFSTRPSSGSHFFPRARTGHRRFTCQSLLFCTTSLVLHFFLLLLLFSLLPRTFRFHTFSDLDAVIMRSKLARPLLYLGGGSACSSSIVAPPRPCLKRSPIRDPIHGWACTGLSACPSPYPLNRPNPISNFPKGFNVVVAL